LIPYLRLDSLTKRYHDTLAADRVTLDIAQGEMIVLLGPSGCGKTTTLRMIAGFVEATEGTIELEGRPIGNLPPHRRDMGMVFQNYALFPHLSVARNVAFGLEMRPIPRPEREKRVAEMLRLVKLDQYAARLPRQLSGGQQQRVAIARALVNSPQIILADEPTGALDTRTSIEIMAIFQRLNREQGITTVIVTHEPDIALYANRNIYFRDGKIVRDEKIADPKQADRDLLQSAPVAAAI